eukprot:5587505-Amphidinium_carterae.1
MKNWIIKWKFSVANWFCSSVIFVCSFCFLTRVRTTARCQVLLGTQRSASSPNSDSLASIVQLQCRDRSVVMLVWTSYSAGT